MHESLQIYTFLERKFHEKYNGDINFLTKSPFLRKSQKTRFLPFFFQNRLQKIEILKIASELFYWLKTSIYILRFLIFVSFCRFLEFHAK